MMSAAAIQNQNRQPWTPTEDEVKALLRVIDDGRALWLPVFALGDHVPDGWEIDDICGDGLDGYRNHLLQSHPYTHEDGSIFLSKMALTWPGGPSATVREALLWILDSIVKAKGVREWAVKGSGYENYTVGFGLESEGQFQIYIQRYRSCGPLSAEDADGPREIADNDSPPWWDDLITGAQLMGIWEDGSESHFPGDVGEFMAEHGDDVLEHLSDCFDLGDFDQDPEQLLFYAIDDCVRTLVYYIEAVIDEA